MPSKGSSTIPTKAPVISRNTRIDALKGYAITLVVLGHAIQFQKLDMDKVLLFKLIYSFHMPLFMCLGGYLAFGSIQKRSLLEILKTRFQSLVVPFIAWYYIVAYLMEAKVLTCNFSEYSWALIQSPGRGLWFLWVLFLCYVVLAVAARAEKYAGSWALVFVAAAFNPFKISLLGTALFIPGRYALFGLSTLAWYVQFFTLGYVAAKYINRVRPYLPIAGAIAVIGFFVLLPEWSRTGPPLFASKYAPAGVPIFLATRITQVYLFAVPICGILASVFLIQSLRNTRVEPILVSLGRRSMGIYAIHWHLVFLVCQFRWFGWVGEQYDWLVIALVFVFCMVISVVLTDLLSRNRMLSMLFLGAKQA